MVSLRALPNQGEREMKSIDAGACMASESNFRDCKPIVALSQLLAGILHFSGPTEAISRSMLMDEE